MDLTEEGLEPSADAMRALIGAAADRIVDHLSRQSELPASSDEHRAAILAKLDEPLPEHGTPYPVLLDQIFRELTTLGINSAGPGALSYIHGGGLLHSAVAELIASSINPYVAYSGPSPGFAKLEQTVVRWFADTMGLPKGAGGVLLSGGSVANLSALVAARHSLLGSDFRGARIYATGDVHHSIPKGAMLAGLPSDVMRVVRGDASGRIDVAALSAAIAEDRALGMRPFMVVGTAGTTNTGAVDDLPALRSIASAERLWFHVDGAYGGLFALTERGRSSLRGIELADTIVLNPHKTLFLPFGTGCLLARDAEALRAAHLLHADYIHAAVEQGEGLGAAANFADLSPELTRPFRGLRVWLPLKLCGASAFRRALDEKLDLTDLAHELIARIPGFEIVTLPSLSTFTFRASAAGASQRASDELNQRVLDRVNSLGRVHLSATRLEGRLTLRVCVLSFRTHRQHLEACAEDLETALAAETT